MIDTHCHLNLEPLRTHWARIWQEAQDQGICRLLNIGIDLPTSQEALEQARHSTGIWSTCGLHPHSAHTHWTPEKPAFKRLMAEKEVVAIGEIGFDFFRQKNVEEQRACFRWFAEQALELNKPVVIHVREAFELLKEELQRYTPHLKGVIHCFTGSAKDAEAFCELGFYISLSGIVTFRNAQQIQEAVPHIPAERLLAETDSPYLAPHPHRGQTNHPAQVLKVIEKLAELRKENISSLQEQLFQNACRLFQLPPLDLKNGHCAQAPLQFKA